MNKEIFSAIGKALGSVSTITTVFIILKLVNVIDWSWWWVLSPTLIVASLIVLIIIVVTLKHR